MHFVSSLSQSEQVSDIISYMKEHMRESLEEDQLTPAFDNFEEKLTKFDDTRDYKGLMTYLLSLKEELLSLPTSHKSSALTIQRAVLCILPILKT